MSSHGRTLLASVLAALLLLPACARTKVVRPQQLQQAERHNLSGIAAEAKQNFADAEAQFRESYRLFSAVENYHGMVTALINSSRLYRRQGEAEKAAAVLKQAVRLMPQTPELEVEVCFESSRLASFQGDRAEALRWAEKGLGAAREAERPRMLNLAAALQLQLGALPQSRELAEAALKSGRSTADRPEEALALRTLAGIALAEKRYPESLQLSEAALAIDKELALPGRVAADLTALADIAEAQGNVPQAADYLQRAVDAASGDSSKAALGSMDRLISLYRQSGNSQAAERAEKLKNYLQQLKAD